MQDSYGQEIKCFQPVAFIHKTFQPGRYGQFTTLSRGRVVKVDPNSVVIEYVAGLTLKQHRCQYPEKVMIL